MLKRNFLGSSLPEQMKPGVSARVPGQKFFTTQGIENTTSCIVTLGVGSEVIPVLGGLFVDASLVSELRATEHSLFPIWQSGLIFCFSGNFIHASGQIESALVSSRTKACGPCTRV